IPRQARAMDRRRVRRAGIDQEPRGTGRIRDIAMLTGRGRRRSSRAAANRQLVAPLPNPLLSFPSLSPVPRKPMSRIHSLLVANRSEIAIRVMRAAAELGMRTVAIFSHEDRFALHRFKADESYQVGEGLKPLQAYLDIDDVI